MAAAIVREIAATRSGPEIMWQERGTVLVCESSRALVCLKSALSTARLADA